MIHSLRPRLSAAQSCALNSWETRERVWVTGGDEQGTDRVMIKESRRDLEKLKQDLAELKQDLF